MSNDRKTVMVIGASRGLGASLAQESVQRGWTAIALARNIEGLRAPAPPAAPGRLIRSKADITDPATWDDALGLAARYRPQMLFWNAGIFTGREPLAEMEEAAIDLLIDTHLRGPIKFLRRFHQLMTVVAAPYHLVTIASTSSYRMRDGEDVYCAAKAGKAAITRQFSRALARDLPGSKTLLVNPGGMKSGLLAPYSDVSKMMDTDAVAKIVWDRADAQTAPYDEINILREDDGTPRVEPGTKTPQAPF